MSAECAALIDRARSLTGAEIQRMAVAWGDAYDEAYDNAWDTAYGTARGAARDDAWDVSYDAVPFAARGVTRETAVALAIRDLIGQSDFTQAHYDTLTGPWRRVIGPPHPDDADQWVS